MEEGTWISPKIFIPRPPFIDNKVYQEAGNFGRMIEEKFKLPCAIVYNPYRIGFGCDIVPLSMILYSDSDLADDLALSKELFIYLDNFFLENGVNNWACHKSLLAQGSLREWFSRFRDAEERFPLMDMAGGADLISYSLYGEELMIKIRSMASSFFHEGIIDFWHREAIRRHREKKKRLKEMRRRVIAHARERKKLLNKHELGEVREFLENIEKEQHEKPFRFIVALDGSGRPLGKALEWYLQKPVKVIYFAPHLLRRLEIKKFSLAEGVVREEFPELYSVWKTMPEEILFIDDQTGYGNTCNSMARFTKYLSGKDAFRLFVMSQYQGVNVPSWLRNRKIQGIEVSKDAFTFRSKERSGAESIAFYDQLYAHVKAWRGEEGKPSI